MNILLSHCMLLLVAAGCTAGFVVPPQYNQHSLLHHSDASNSNTIKLPDMSLFSQRQPSSTSSSSSSSSWESAAKSTIAAGLLAASTIFFLSHSPPPAFADGGARIVGSIQGSGLVFKDTLQIESFEDPKVKGVTLYVSNFQRPLTERLTSNFLADPSYASVACAKTGPVSIADNIVKGKGGEQVFDESRSLFFKTLRVQRLFDEDKNTVVYVSYSTRLDKGDDTNKSRFKSSLCAVNLDELPAAATSAALGTPPPSASTD